MRQTDPLLKSFGIAVRRSRQVAGLSQEGLALEAGLDRTYIGGVERGERNASLINVGKIATALGSTPSALLAKAERGEVAG